MKDTVIEADQDHMTDDVEVDLDLMNIDVDLGQGLDHITRDALLPVEGTLLEDLDMKVGLLTCLDAVGHMRKLQEDDYIFTAFFILKKY